MVNDGAAAITNKDNVFGLFAGDATQPYFYLEKPGFDPQNVDFNNFGILYQFCGAYYIVYNHLNPESNKPSLTHGWVPQDNVGPYLKREWESLPKQKIGRFGEGIASGDSTWNVHSDTIQSLRGFCVMIATRVEALVAIHLQTRGQKVGLNDQGKRLLREFKRVIDATVGTKFVKDSAVAEDSDSFMKEFMVFED